MFAISAIVKGFLWGAAAVEPVIQILGLGSVFAAWNMIQMSENSSDEENYPSWEIKDLNERWTDTETEAS